MVKCLTTSFWIYKYWRENIFIFNYFICIEHGATNVEDDVRMMSGW